MSSILSHLSIQICFLLARFASFLKTQQNKISSHTTLQSLYSLVGLQFGIWEFFSMSNWTLWDNSVCNYSVWKSFLQTSCKFRPSNQMPAVTASLSPHRRWLRINLETTRLPRHLVFNLQGASLPWWVNTTRRSSNIPVLRHMQSRGGCTHLNRRLPRAPQASRSRGKSDS